MFRINGLHENFIFVDILNRQNVCFICMPRRDHLGAYIEMPFLFLCISLSQDSLAYINIVRYKILAGSTDFYNI